MIKFGDIEYFTLLDLRDRINADKYTKLDLLSLDRLRTEVNIKIEAIHEAHLRNPKSSETHSCKYSKAMNQPYPRLCVICGEPEKAIK